jgi:uncharacterized membrane protein
MDGMVFIGILLVIALFIGSVLGFVNLIQIGDLKREIRALKQSISSQNSQRIEQEPQANEPREESQPVEPQSEPSSVAQDLPLQDVLDENDQPQPINTDIGTTHQHASDNKPLDSQRVTPKASETNKSNAKKGFDLEKLLSGNGLLWLGAIVLAIGGIFLAKYSIEAGLLPPHVRIFFGVAFGIALVVGAEYLHRHPKRFDINSPMISAALASGGFITCFAMTLVAFDFYDYLSPTLAFVVLAVIALASAWLSLRFGPILAAIGVIGAYVVPALVSTGSNNVLMLLMYVSAVSFSAVWIHQIVQRNWLWYLGAAGHFIWYALAIMLSTELSFVDGQASTVYPNLMVITGFAILSVYLYSMLPVMGWDLKQSTFQALALKDLLMPRKEQLGVLLPLLGLIVYAAFFPFDHAFLLVVLAISLVLLAVPLRCSAFDSWPFLALGFVIIIYLQMPQDYDFSDNVFPFTGGYLFVQISALISLLYAFAVNKYLPSRPAYLLLLVSAPLLLMSISYALSPVFAADLLYPLFALELGVVALVFATLAIKEPTPLTKMSYLLLANGALSLIFTMMLSASALTLALAIQIGLMASLSKRFEVSLPTWIYKVAILIVMLRLTAAPWLPKYADELLLGLHWSLIIYPTVFAVLWFARKQLPMNALRHWLTGALLHIIALFITTESSYFLTGEYPDFANLSFEQSTLLGLNWLILGAVYLWRQRFTSHQKLYRIFALLLFVGVLFMQLSTTLFANPYISDQPIGESIIFNWLLPLWGLPGAVLIVMLSLQLVIKKLQTLVFTLIALFMFLYINSIVRLSFNEQLNFFTTPMVQAELYTYSVLWLCIAVAFILAAQLLQRYPFVLLNKARINKIGFGILAAVILKAFLVDMANLEGLLRALSFIALGLSLVGIGWLFQRFNHAPKQREQLE